jgi:thiamine biosynthesis lipoprotein
MGSPFYLIFYTTDTVQAAQIANKTFLFVDSMVNIFSNYIDSSEINKLSGSAGSGNALSASTHLYNVLRISQQAWQASKKTFDVTIGPLSLLWREARKQKRFPVAEEVLTAKTRVGFEKVKLYTINKKIALLHPRMSLDMGGIAKGYIAQQAIFFLKSKGITMAMVGASGDICCSGAPPGKKGWNIGITQPGETDLIIDKTILLQNKAVSTSGDVYQYTIHNGKKYSHIINPKTGYGVTFQRNVTVIAPEGSTSDWLATACSILPIKKAKRLVKKYGSDLLITQMQGKKIKYFTTPGIKTYFASTFNHIP